MKGRIRQFTAALVRLLSTRWFMWLVVALFVFQALWIAFSFRFSMIYDERYHFSLIQFFSHQLSPFIFNQSADLDRYGELSRDPYLLYHYVLSFPFRLVASFTSNLAVQVLAMRITNIALFGSGLVVFWYLFKEMGVKPIFRNIALLFFVLLPVTPFIAATINYDNAVFPLTALLMLVGLRILKSNKLKWQDVALFVLIGLAGCLTKSAYPPIFAAGFIFIAVWVLRKKKNRQALGEVKKSFVDSSVWVKAALIVPVLVVVGLFMATFGVNVVKYHSLSPSCERVLSKDRCNADPLNARATKLLADRSGKIPDQAPEYIQDWASYMIYTLMFTGNNTDGPAGTVYAPPLPIVYLVVFLLVVVSAAAVLYKFDVLRKIPGFWFLASIIGLYLVALFYTNVTEYYKYYQMLAVQGRYLIPLLPLLMLFSLLAINDTFGRMRTVKVALLLIVFVLFMNGAGLITHVMRSNDSWDWKNSSIRSANDKLRNILTPVIREWWFPR